MYEVLTSKGTKYFCLKDKEINCLLNCDFDKISPKHKKYCNEKGVDILIYKDGFLIASINQTKKGGDEVC